jgi:putative copper export protein
MKTVHIILFFIWFGAFFVLFGGQYDRIGLSYQSWCAVTIVLSVALVGSYLAEYIIEKRKKG